MDIQHLSQTDRIHLNAASGWFGLGNFEEAHMELEHISHDMQTHPSVLLTRCQICYAAEKWEQVIFIAETLVKQLPKLDEPWIQRSYALHELKRTQEAFDCLLPAAELFPINWLTRYNLACYCARLGKLEDAMCWLEKAIDLADKRDIRMMALEDSDLEALWAQVSEI